MSKQLKSRDRLLSYVKSKEVVFRQVATQKKIGSTFAFVDRLLTLLGGRPRGINVVSYQRALKFSTSTPIVPYSTKVGYTRQASNPAKPYCTQAGKEAGIALFP
jgi:hypothetical protein